jgi:hypothetical protein
MNGSTFSSAVSAKEAEEGAALYSEVNPLDSHLLGLTRTINLP